MSDRWNWADDSEPVPRPDVRLEVRPRVAQQWPRLSPDQQRLLEILLSAPAPIAPADLPGRLRGPSARNLLRRMALKGWIRGEDPIVPRGRTTQRRYAITPLGHAVLRAWQNCRDLLDQAKR